MAPTQALAANRLLAALPVADLERWRMHLEWIAMPFGQVLYESGSAPSHVVFPTTAIAALLYAMESGASAEIAMVGNEGLVGVSVFMGGGSTPARAVVQCAGHGFRMKAQFLKDEFESCPRVTRLLLRYTQALIAQMAQTALCNRHHSVDQQLCRFLLLCLDRLPGNEMQMTHELISHMLGVRREGVTQSAYKLSEAGLIRYSRGHIHVLDRPGLEVLSCECYAVVTKEHERVFHPA